jgi:hypothetical protein
MTNITYTVNQDTPQSIASVEILSQEDTNLINTFQVNQLFDSSEHVVELHIYNLAGELQESEYDYRNYKELGNAASAGKKGASVLTIDPIEDVKVYGYDNGGVKLFYNFINDLYTTGRDSVEFFIDSISPDRTELKLKTFNLTSEELTTFTTSIKTKLETQSYFNEFRVNLLSNDLLIGVNIDTLQEGDDTVVVVKLYEPLLEDIVEKSTLRIVELVSDSTVYEVTSTFETEVESALQLRSPNFNLDLADENVIPTDYYTYDTLLSLPITNTTNELYSLVNSKGVQLSIDHNDYSNFVHFSSAQERLLNFKYKLDLIQSYNTQIANVQAVTTSSLGTTGSITYYQDLVKGIVNNFDHYERFLYYESGSNSWPKTNSTKPYINDTTSGADTWFNNKLTVAATYDVTNTNILINSIPSYLRDDSSNASYITFIHMIGQHFDNMWIYAKGVSDKYNADNRLNFGVSRDLVAEVLKNFGVKLYTSNKSIEDLFSSFIGQPYQSGSEKIATYVTGSVTGSNTPIQPSSFDNYQREIYKRIYHNLPLLLKSKGTERGLRALINCFGIPSDILDVKTYGGRKVSTTPFYGDYQHYTSSLDKIRLDNTGSILTGSTLSGYTSIVKREYKYTDDVHSIEVGFSPTDNIDKFILDSGSIAISASIAAINTNIASESIAQQVAAYSASINQIVTDYSTRVLADGGSIEDLENLSDIVWGLAIPAPTFTSTATSLSYEFTTIDEFLGNPQNLYESDYSGLNTVVEYITRDLDAYNVQDYVRLIKFFDNTVFKMVKDFIPARAVADTGVIIKPHLLQRSKAKSPTLQGTRPEYTASIDTGFIQGKSAGAYDSVTQGGVDGELNTIYPTYVQTLFGIGTTDAHLHQEARINGELAGGTIRVSNGELNSANLFKTPTFFTNPFDVTRWINAEGLCILNPYTTYTDVQGGIYYSSSNNTLYLNSGSWNSNNIYTGLSQNMEYEITSSNIPTGSFIFPFNTNNYANYTTHSLTASNEGVEGICTSSIKIQVAVCDIQTTEQFRQNVTNTNVYNLQNWFTIGSQNLPANINLNIVNNTNSNVVYNGLLSSAGAATITFTGAATHTYTLTVQDTKIPLTCTYNYPIAAGLCSVVTESKALIDRADWRLKKYVGTTDTTQVIPGSTIYNYGLARYFTGENPATLSYRVEILDNYSFGSVIASIVVTPPSALQSVNTGQGEFGNGPYGGGIYKYSWRYGPQTTSPAITGNVALFKIEYTDIFLLTYPSQVDQEYIEGLTLRITALESEPDCTPFVLIEPTSPPVADIPNHLCDNGQYAYSPEECITEDTGGDDPDRFR